MQRLGQNIKRERLARGLSQEELAARAGMHRTYVGAVERGERNISVVSLLRLAMALDVRVTNLTRNIDPGRP
ncbi:MAG TPA: helix-turn-helix transcriptional regulator [Gammaproteobacteria bacterium]|nr:helix-turn-helix transcriptional regulator [Gammaproteobacteria bacterium]